MTYSPRPKHTNGEINRAGKTLRTAAPSSDEYIQALDIVNQWRTCHAYPLSTFKSTLRKKASKYPGSLVAQRLKRLPTIVNKLGRFETLNLTQMQDIGGIRAVVETVGEVRVLQSEYKDSRRFTHTLVTEKDYIETPKIDGYRGVHLVYRYHNTLARNGRAGDYEGLQIELQLRTQLQHTWATAVETVGTLKGQAIKTGSGAKKMKEFLGLVSSAFAIAEGQPVLEVHRSLQPLEIFQKIKKLEKELKFTETISGLSAAARIIHTNETVGSYYNLIRLDTKNHSISFMGYAQNKLEEATRAYAKAEKDAADWEDIVLVSAGDLKSLKAAYPNYFLDVKDFLQKIHLIIEQIKE